MTFDQEQQLNRAVALQTKWAPYVREKLLPALAALNLDYFWYVRLLPGAFHLSIGIQPPMVDIYLKRKTAELYFNNLQILVQKQTTVLWDLQVPNKLTSDMNDKLGLRNGLCLFRRRKDYIEVWYLASTKSNADLYQLYLNNTSAIFRLVSFFQEEVLPQLPIKDKDFLLPYMDGTTLILPPLARKASHPKMTDFYDATTMKKFTLHGNNSDFQLTLRELQCVHRLAQGETCKEIAKNIGLSYRTVEHYIEDARHKSGCADKSELAAMYRKNDIAIWFEG
jgi:DNA-binding CsgD family transcriptional regulator